MQSLTIGDASKGNLHGTVIAPTLPFALSPAAKPSASVPVRAQSYPSASLPALPPPNVKFCR
jgi:hypothetical protein